MRNRTLGATFRFHNLKNLKITLLGIYQLFVKNKFRFQLVCQIIKKYCNVMVMVTKHRSLGANFNKFTIYKLKEKNGLSSICIETSTLYM